MEKLLKQWMTAKESITYEVKKSITFQYMPSAQMLKRRIVEALAFWDFVRNMLKNESISVSEKRAFLTSFVADANKFIGIVAKLEILPDRIYKKVLWRGNIDFLSFESFLRRITPEQEQLIAQTYEDFFVSDTKKTPLVFRLSIRDWFSFLIQKISVEKECSGAYGEPDRWMSKGAWAFNLLGLDFGFSLYSKGVLDDTKITNKKFTRFFSIKEHINDFIVNQFDGKYWWMYRFARSNDAWFPKKDVQLKTHICPGFWMTLCIHVLLWIVSPLVFIGTITNLLQADTPKLGDVCFAISALYPTPILVLIALLGLFGHLIATYGGPIGEGVEKYITRIKDWNEDWSERNAKILGSIKAITVCVFVAALLIFIYGAIIYYTPVLLGLMGKINILESTRGVFALTVIVWVILSIKYIVDALKERRIVVPVIAKFLPILSVCMTAINIYDAYASQAVSLFLTGWMESIVNLIRTYPRTTTLLFLAFAGLGVLVMWMNMLLQDEEKFANRTKKIRVLSLSLCAVMIAFFVVAVKDENVFNLTYGAYLVATIALAVIVGFAILFLATLPINEQTIAKRSVSKHFASQIGMYFRFDKMKTKSFGFKQLMNNQWLLSVQKEEADRLFNKLGSGVSQFLDCDSETNERFRFLFIQKHLWTIDEKVANNLLEAITWFESRIDDYYEGFHRFNNFERYTFLSMVAEGSSVQNAIISVDRLHKQAIQRARRVRIGGLRRFVYFRKYIIRPLKKAVQPFVWIARKIYQGSATLKDLWRLFNKHCPFVSKSEKLA